MTEKEFENLKVGDNVWYRRPSADYKTTEVVCREIRQKKESPIFGTKEVFIDCLHHDCHCDGVWRNWYEGSLTKSEEWQKEVSDYEETVKYAEMDLVGYKKHLAHAKAELAKAKEEESGWVIINEHICKAFPSDRYRGFQKYATEQEAYEALAKCCERKLFKALEKCGYKFAISCDKLIVPMLVRAEEDVCHVIYYPSHSYGCVRKQDLFDTLDEAEAELERRKK